MEKETVHEFDIPLRELTEEERTRDLTVERIREFHYLVGEDFLDQAGSINVQIFAGYLIGIYPNLSKEILKVINKAAKDKSLLLLDVNDFSDIKEFGYDKEIDMERIYIDYCNFVNLTEAQKARDNQVLIQVIEEYRK